MWDKGVELFFMHLYPAARHKPTREKQIRKEEKYAQALGMKRDDKLRGTAGWSFGRQTNGATQ